MKNAAAVLLLAAAGLAPALADSPFRRDGLCPSDCSGSLEARCRAVRRTLAREAETLLSAEDPLSAVTEARILELRAWGLKELSERLIDTRCEAEEEAYPDLKSLRDPGLVLERIDGERIRWIGRCLEPHPEELRGLAERRDRAAKAAGAAPEGPSLASGVDAADGSAEVAAAVPSGDVPPDVASVDPARSSPDGSADSARALGGLFDRSAYRGEEPEVRRSERSESRFRGEAGWKRGGSEGGAGAGSGGASRSDESSTEREPVGHRARPSARTGPSVTTEPEARGSRSGVPPGGSGADQEKGGGPGRAARVALDAVVGDAALPVSLTYAAEEVRARSCERTEEPAAGAGSGSGGRVNLVIQLGVVDDETDAYVAEHRAALYRRSFPDQRAAVVRAGSLDELKGKLAAVLEDGETVRGLFVNSHAFEDPMTGLPALSVIEDGDDILLLSDWERSWAEFVEERITSRHAGRGGEFISRQVSLYEDVRVKMRDASIGAVFAPLAGRFAPDAVVVFTGCELLREDPGEVLNAIADALEIDSGRVYANTSIGSDARLENASRNRDRPLIRWASSLRAFIDDRVLHNKGYALVRAGGGSCLVRSRRDDHL